MLLRAVLRQLTRNSGFSAAVICTLALGIGSSVLIYSVIHAVLLEPLPYDDPARIVRLDELDANGNSPRLTDPNFYDIKEQTKSFAALAQFGSVVESVAGGTEPVRANLAAVSRDLLAVMRVQPALGRAFTEDEQKLGAAPAALVSHAFWQRNLGGIADFASRPLKIGDRVHTVVGVMPPGFHYPNKADIWVPRELWPVGISRTGHNYESIGRLAPGVTLDAARAELAGIAARLKEQHGNDTQMVDVKVVTLHESLVGDVRPALLVMLLAVALLFLVACANVASMLLARTMARVEELAVRLALGAGRWGLVRLFVTEALVLCILGGALGVLFASAGVELLAVLEAGALPRAEGLRVDWTAVALAVSIASGLAVALGVAVTVLAVGDDVAHAGARRTIGTPRSRVRDGLVAAQVAMALVLVVGAVLLARSFLSAAAVDPGYRVADVTLMNLAVARPPTPEGRARLAVFYDELLPRLRALPGVEAAGGVSSPPLAGNGTNGGFVTVQRADEIRDFAALRTAYTDPEKNGYAEFRLASDGYFEAMGIAVLQGRAFDERDGPGPLHSAIISRSLAESQWPGEDPLGKLIQFGGMDGDLTAFAVVGVVDDVYDYGVDFGPQPTFYASYRQRQGHLASFWVAMKGPDAATLVPAARSIVQTLNPDVPPEFRTAEDLYGDTLAQRKLQLVILGVFGGSALFLALVGIYSAVAFAVLRRTREIGLRMALGARASKIVRAMVARSLAVVGIGLAMGSVIAFVGSQLLTSMLYDVAPHDAETYVLAVIALLLGAAVVSWWPARRAAAVDPNIALRQE
jgi:putative ABC transport system permease protein